MHVDERRSRWEEAENEGRKARLEDEPLRSNPYQSAGLTLEATLHVCWQRGWMDADRELASEKGESGSPKFGGWDTRKLIAL